MAPLGPATVVGIVGAGAMGSGIAQVAAAAGHHVLLHDARPGAADAAVRTIAAALDRQVEKKKLSGDAARDTVGRMRAVAAGGGELSPLSACGLVIEAIVEELAVKRHTFSKLEGVVAADCVLATNTSSLSITAIAGACAHPERVVGIHFFNPAPVLPLVEIVPGLATSPGVVQATRALVDAWGKTTVLASDTPGFIVNRVARPFYGESLRILEEGIADTASIDWAMRDIGGFRMGPFELMDFIGNDVNFATTSTVFEGTFFDQRYAPSVTQQRLVQAGLLGRKTGRGFYDYTDGAQVPEPRRDAVGAKEIVDRVLAMLVNEAAEAVAMGIASPHDIDIAMTKGVNYPKGLLRWGNEIGLGRVVETLERLQRDHGGARYRPSQLLRRMASEGREFHR